jgi:hypothetical protein
MSTATTVSAAAITTSDNDQGQEQQRQYYQPPLSLNSLSSSLGPQFDKFGRKYTSSTTTKPSRLRKTQRTTTSSSILGYHDSHQEYEYYGNDNSLNIEINQRSEETRTLFGGQNWNQVSASYHASAHHTDGLVVIDVAKNHNSNVDNNNMFTTDNSKFKLVDRMHNINQRVRTQQLEAMFEAEEMQSILDMSMSIPPPPVSFFLVDFFSFN